MALAMSTSGLARADLHVVTDMDAASSRGSPWHSQ